MKLRTKHSYWKTGRKCLKNIFIAASCAEIFLHDCVVRLYFRRALESGPRSSSRGDWGEVRGLASRSAASVQAHCVLRNNSWLFDVLVWQIYYSIFILYKDLNVQSLSISLDVIVCQQKFSFWKVHWWKQRSAHTVNFVALAASPAKFTLHFLPCIMKIRHFSLLKRLSCRPEGQSVVVD